MTFYKFPSNNKKKKYSVIQDDTPSETRWKRGIAWKKIYYLFFASNYIPCNSRFRDFNRKRFDRLTRSKSTKVKDDVSEGLPIAKDPRSYPAVSPKRGLRKRGVLRGVIVECITVGVLRDPCQSSVAFSPSRRDRQSCSSRFLSSRSAWIPLRESREAFPLSSSRGWIREMPRRINDDEPSERCRRNFRENQPFMARRRRRRNVYEKTKFAK